MIEILPDKKNYVNEQKMNNIFKQSSKLKIGIVGARDWTHERQIEWYIRDLPQNVCIVSGGAVGVDKMAVHYANQYGIEYLEIMPDLSGCTQRHEFTKRYYERNQAIVDQVDFLIAFVNKDTGGTWDTIRRAYKKQIPVKIFKPSLFVGYPSIDEPEEKIIESTIDRKGKGPFAIKRVSLGSYALHLKRYIDVDRWAKFLHGKETCSEELVNEISLDFIQFFKNHKNFGKINFITIPPRSIRNIEKPHIMEKVLKKVSDAIDAPMDVVFQPWNKLGRGRFAKRSEIEISENIKKYIGEVCFVLDDVTTTNYTLQSAVKALMSLEIHAHGLAWILMS